MVLFKIALNNGTITKAGILFSNYNSIKRINELFFVEEVKYNEMKNAGTLKNIFSDEKLLIDLKQFKIIQTEIIFD